MKTKIFFSIQFAVILFLPFKTLLAQADLNATAPTLQVGLDGFNFAKGSLDAQLIMEIVAEKQKELKVKAIQNVFLNKVENAGGSVYTFVDNVVRELVFEPDQEVRTKKILENTVNLVFTTSYLNFYISTLIMKSDDRKYLVRLAYKFNNTLDTNYLINKDKLYITDFSTKPKSSNFFEDEKAVTFTALLIDMCSKAIREDKKLKQLGLMQTAYSETYEYLNLYNKLLRDSSISTTLNVPKTTRVVVTEKDSTKMDIIINSLNLTRKQKRDLLNNKNDSFKIEVIQLSRQIEIISLADTIFNKIKLSLSKCTDFIGVVNYLVEQKTFRFDLENPIDHKILDTNEVSFNNAKLIGIRDSLKNLIKKLESEQPYALSKFSTIEGVNVLVQKQDSSLKADLQILVEIYFYIDKAVKQIEATKSKKDNLTKLKTYGEILYTLNNDFVPLLKNQSFRSYKYVEIIDLMNVFNNEFFTNIISTNEVLKKYESEIPQFLLLVSKLYQFDRGSTISEYMKFLDDIGTIFPDDNIRNALSTVLKFVKDYSVIDKNSNSKEVLSFNIESFLYKLQTIKPYKLNRVSFLFSVGVNNAIFQQNFKLPDSSISRNFSFIGEKIGVRYILWDWAFSRTRNPGETYQIFCENSRPFIRNAPPKDPIVSNWHILAYGSGILYNLVNTKTQKEFNMPIIGIGSGLTFYNGLDFNISWGVPITSNHPISSDNGFWNVGFDIQFIEYYDRLMEKRKNNQIQKRLVEAQKN